MKNKNSALESLRIRIEAAQTLEEAQHVAKILWHLIDGSSAGPCPGCAWNHQAAAQRLRRQRATWVSRR